MKSDAIARRAIRRGAQQKTAELTAFLDLLTAFLKPEVVVEIGVAEGATLWAWRQVAPTVIGIDNNPAAMTSMDSLVIMGDSHEQSTLETLIRILDGRLIDCLFLDGDHSYGGVRQDYEMYGGLVRSGGIIAFHDIVSVSPDGIYEIGVDKFWAEICDSTAVEIIDSTPGSGAPWADTWGGIGIITP